jgi:hypothetical protein
MYFLCFLETTIHMWLLQIKKYNISNESDYQCLVTKSKSFMNLRNNILVIQTQAILFSEYKSQYLSSNMWVT